MKLPGGGSRLITGAVLAVDVSDPRKPRQIAQLADGVPNGTEGVYVPSGRSFAYVGGYYDSRLVAIDLRELPNGSLSIARTWRDPAYVQLVSTPQHGPVGPDHRTMLLALFGQSGGLASFELSADPSDPSTTEIGRLSLPELNGANRVDLQPSRRLAWLPLQQPKRGAFAAVDVSNVSRLQLTLQPVDVPGDSAQLFCLVVDADHVYAFAPGGATMHVYQVV